MPDNMKITKHVFHPDYSAPMHDDYLQRSSGDTMRAPAYMRTHEQPAEPVTREVSIETVTAVRSLLEDMAETFRTCGLNDLAEQADTVVELLA